MVTNLEGSRHGQTEWLDHDGLLEPLESESESFSGVSVQDGGGRVGKGSWRKRPAQTTTMTGGVLKWERRQGTSRHLIPDGTWKTMILVVRQVCCS